MFEKTQYCNWKGGTRVTTSTLSTDQIRFNAPNAQTNSLVVTGAINTSNDLNIV